MSSQNQEVLEKKFISIKRGVYWFGICGRLTIFFGILLIFLGLILLGIDATNSSINFTFTKEYSTLLIGSIECLFFGWLLLIARDAFEAIQALIQEMREIV